MKVCQLWAAGGLDYDLQEFFVEVKPNEIVAFHLQQTLNLLLSLKETL